VEKHEIRTSARLDDLYAADIHVFDGKCQGPR
jgi:hypothetical protein